jgi:DMSO/TMAO reductase YedYZ molybdopterin-dependent catalytic subunit
MQHELHACYRGHEITARSMETFDWAARSHADKNTHQPLHWFTASFSVHPIQTTGPSWQQFPADRFLSADRAMSHARLVAERSIDGKSEAEKN